MSAVEIDPARPLSELTTLRVGAAPDRMREARTRDELVGALRDAWADDEEALVVGGGSNLFAGDDPFEGTVVLVRSHGIETLPAPAPGIRRLRIEAGHGWDDLVAFAVAEGLSGIEGMAGIPGTTGAAPVQNIGAYGQEIVQSLVEVELLDRATQEVVTVPAGELGLGFRTSDLKEHHGSAARRPGVILRVTLDLREVGTGAVPVRGEQLRGSLRIGEDERVSLAEIRERVLSTRRQKGMVLDPVDPDTYSAGSFFQNAIVSRAFAHTLPPECPRWPVAPVTDPVTVIDLDRFDGYVPRAPEAADPPVKISAAWLIEHAGIPKGFALPGSRAALSSKHALALTNRGSASASEIAQLARFIQQRVQQEFGLILQPEPVLVGVEL